MFVTYGVSFFFKEDKLKYVNFFCGKNINICAKYPSSLRTLYVHRVQLTLGSNVLQHFYQIENLLLR